jgi:hypothetical protein
MQRTIFVAAITSVLTVTTPGAFAALTQSHTGGRVTVRIAVANNGQDVTDGGVEVVP